VLHFCFRCERIGHALGNCESEEVDEDSIRFGEELRASPPHRVKEINLKPVAPRVIKPLFQVAGMQTRATSSGGLVGGQHTGSSNSGQGSRSRDGIVEGIQGKNMLADYLRNVITSDLAHGVKDMQVDCQSPHDSGTSCNCGGKE
jgi:hypothetical protein